VPTAIKEEMALRGWITRKRTEDHVDEVHFTDLGARLTDLFAPETGVDPIPQESQV